MNLGIFLAPWLTNRCSPAPQVCRGRDATGHLVRVQLLESPLSTVRKHLRRNNRSFHWQETWRRSLNIGPAVSTSSPSRALRRPVRRRLPRREALLQAAVPAEDFTEEEVTAASQSRPGCSPQQARGRGEGSVAKEPYGTSTGSVWLYERARRTYVAGSNAPTARQRQGQERGSFHSRVVKGEATRGRALRGREGGGGSSSCPQ